MSFDPSEDLLSQSESRRPRSNRWLLVAAGGVLLATGFYSSKLVHAAPKPQISAEDTLAIVKIQSKIRAIQDKLTSDTKSLQDKAQAEAAPFFKDGQAIQSRVCKANGFPATCFLDLENQKVMKEAPKPDAKSSVPAEVPAKK